VRHLVLEDIVSRWRDAQEYLAPIAAALRGRPAPVFMIRQPDGVAETTSAAREAKAR
jgi:hypothetical protein